GSIDGVAGGSGHGGNIHVGADSVVIGNAGAVGMASTTTAATARGGGTSNSGLLAVFTAPSAITASATPGATGSAGNVTVNAGSLSIQPGGEISSATNGPGIGGDIVITSPTVTLTGKGPQITAQSFGSGNAGSITVNANTLTLTGGASISTEAAQANGGDITLNIGHLLLLVDSEITTSVNGAFGNGGNILIDPLFVVLNHSRIIANAVGGNGGNITILADEFVSSADSVIQASSQLGVSGTIDILSPIVQVNGALASLSDELRAVATVARDNCAARGDLPRSSLVSAGRGGVTQDPDAALPALYLAGRDLRLGRGGNAALRLGDGGSRLAALPAASPCK
ncbi:MAG: hypothetical protein JO258_05010, partial [Alphaproteobacteria bacterium]|nr:hypothetical protein [Alphaproteobacteria bacterium]